VLNEMTAVRDYATVTFGLLEGWWRAADPERRLPHAPLLSVPLWREALAAAGLEVVATTPPAEDDPGSTPQAVLVARAEPARSGPDPAGVERRTAIEAAVIEVVAEVFEMPEQKVRTSGVLSFSELGADSLLSAELAARVGARLAIPLKTTAIFNFPGIRELAAHIEAEFPNAALPATGAPMPYPPATPDEDVLGRVLRALEAGEIDVDEALRRAPLSP
jgi:acyl carrier protein